MTQELLVDLFAPVIAGLLVLVFISSFVTKWFEHNRPRGMHRDPTNTRRLRNQSPEDTLSFYLTKKEG